MRAGFARFPGTNVDLTLCSARRNLPATIAIASFAAAPIKIKKAQNQKGRRDAGLFHLRENDPDQ
jgi:hypothetical protein